MNGNGDSVNGADTSPGRLIPLAQFIPPPTTEICGCKVVRALRLPEYNDDGCDCDLLSPDFNAFRAAGQGQRDLPCTDISLDFSLRALAEQDESLSYHEWVTQRRPVKRPPGLPLPPRRPYEPRSPGSPGRSSACCDVNLDEWESWYGSNASNVGCLELQSQQSGGQPPAGHHLAADCIGPGTAACVVNDEDLDDECDEWFARNVACGNFASWLQDELAASGVGGQGGSGQATEPGADYKVPIIGDALAISNGASYWQRGDTSRVGDDGAGHSSASAPDQGIDGDTHLCCSQSVMEALACECPRLEVGLPRSSGHIRSPFAIAAQTPASGGGWCSDGGKDGRNSSSGGGEEKESWSSSGTDEETDCCSAPASPVSSDCRTCFEESSRDSSRSCSALSLQSLGDAHGASSCEGEDEDQEQCEGDGVPESEWGCPLLPDGPPCDSDDGMLGVPCVDCGLWEQEVVCKAAACGSRAAPPCSGVVPRIAVRQWMPERALAWSLDPRDEIDDGAHALAGCELDCPEWFEPHLMSMLGAVVHEALFGVQCW